MRFRRSVGAAWLAAGLALQAQIVTGCASSRTAAGPPAQAAATTPARQPVSALTKQAQAALSPADALQRLKEGNARFVAGLGLPRDLREQVRATSGGQYPFAAVVGCIDSRVPPELVFDQGIGDLFSARIAGNFVDPDILGSLEFATKLSGSKLILVLGHTRCGAIKGACDDVKMGNLTTTLSHLRPAVDAVKDVPGARDSKNEEFVNAVTHTNVKLTLEAIRKQSPILDDLIARGELGLAGGVYDVETGVVEFLE